MEDGQKITSKSWSIGNGAECNGAMSSLRSPSPATECALPIGAGLNATIVTLTPEGEIADSRTAWLGREGSNLRMGESKSGGICSNINAHSEF
jgi:hypothetical protein